MSSASQHLSETPSTEARPGPSPSDDATHSFNPPQYLDVSEKATHAQGTIPHTNLRATTTSRTVVASPLQPHRTSLPDFFYLLSFCPPLPSPFTFPRAFARHPAVLYVVGFICALLAGCCMPALDILYGIYTNRVTPGSSSPQDIRDAGSYIGWIMTIVGVGGLITCWAFLACFSSASHDLSQRLRHAYVSAVLAQDASHFDLHGAGEIANRAGKDIGSIRVGFGEKLGYVVWGFSTLLVSVIIGFVKAPIIAAVLFCMLPITIAIFTILGRATEKVGAPVLRIEGRASTFLEQVLGSVRVVQSFGMESELMKRFDQAMLKPLEKLGMRKAAIRGLEMGAVYTMLNLTYSLAFWWGSINVVNDRVSVGSLLTAFWNYLNTLFSFANLVPHLAAIFDSWTALRQVRLAIERVPKIDVRDQSGLRLPDAGAPGSDWEPSFELRDVTFAYPSRPDIATLRGVSIKFRPGKVTALVGPSGSGKSTVTGLLLREYDPETANVPHPDDVKAALLDKKNNDDDDQDDLDQPPKPKSGKLFGIIPRKKSAQSNEADTAEVEKATPSKETDTPVEGSGEVVFAGRDIRDYNLSWLRSQIAIVQQHPQLFTASIFENVAAGLTGTDWAYSPDVDGDPNAPPHIKARTELIRAKVQEALEKAQAWGFVQNLPEGMDTIVSGGRTGLLSGGQRQRVAIARALVRQPRVLCLDEGTSALDSDTESKIKAVLQKEQEERGMTTILIAHRLSTIEHADLIVTLKKGKVIEMGTHEELMKAKAGEDGTYRSMVTQQKNFAAYEKDDGTESIKADAAKTSDDQIDSSSSDSFSSKELDSPGQGEVEDRLGRECLSDGTTTRVEGGSSVRSPSSAPEAQTRPSPLATRHRSSRASEHSHWQLSGRMGSAVGQVEHAAEAPAAHVEAPPASSLAIKQSGKESTKSDGHSSGDSASASSDKIDKAKAKEEKRKMLRTFMRFVWEQRLFFLVGIVGGIATGASFPIAGWMTGGTVNSLSIENDDARLRSEVNRWSLWFLILAIVDLFIVLINSFFLEVASEHIVRRLKKHGLAALIRQEIGFFDSEDHASGAMSAAVSSHPSNVGAATGLVLSQVIISATNLLGSVILGLVLSWKTSLVCLAPIFVLFVSGYLNIVMLEKYEAIAQKPVDRAASYISENVDAIKTVAALGREAETMRLFDEQAKSDPKRTRYLIFGAGGFAVSQAMVQLLSALVFWWGAQLLSKDDVSLTALYATFEAVIIAAFSAGRLFTFVPDYGRATNSFKTVSGWINRIPRVAGKLTGLALKDGVDDGTLAEGDIELHSIELRYPQRPQHPALRDLNLTIPAGKSVAFCGTSGSGKSSILALLQRFYDPSRGTITFGGHDVRGIPLSKLREHMAYVTQDPILYEGTIRWNLLLGAVDASSITQERLEAVCQSACILDFIRGLPNGFETSVGLKGSQLSGGQKQRLCIARALLRDPKILLLDEATSALDAEAEGAVQRALDNAAKGRTTITIAHRLSSLRKADWIFVIEDGKIREQGTHAHLLANGGRYMELMEAQL